MITISIRVCVHNLYHKQSWEYKKKIQLLFLSGKIKNLIFVADIT